MDPAGDALRVYLDSAILCQLGDGSLPTEQCERLTAALRTTDAVILISPAHLVDVFHRTDAATRARVLAAVNQFPRVAAVAEDIVSAERVLLDDALRSGNTPDPPSLTLETLTDPAAQLTKFADLMTGVGAAADANAAAMEAGRAAAQGEFKPNKQQRALMKELKLVMMGEASEERVVEVLEKLRAAIPDAPAVDPQLLAQGLGLMRHLQQSLGPLKDEIASEGGDTVRFASSLSRSGDAIADIKWTAVDGGEQRWLEAAPLCAPGYFPSRVLHSTRRRDSNRPNLPSDLADEMHVAYTPYFDLGTLDKHVVGLIGPHLAKCRRRRAGRLFKNGQLDELIHALERH